MIDQRQKIFAAKLCISDLLLTVMSFLLAYRVRISFELAQHTMMPLRTYLWLLAIILPTWAVLLPAFRAYSQDALSLREQLLRLTKAIGLAWLVMLALQFFVDADRSNRFILVLTLIVNYILLVSFRLVLFRMKKYGARDVRHVAVIGRGAIAEGMARAATEHQHWGLKLVGVFLLDDARTLLEQGGIDELIFVADNSSLDSLREIIPLCEERGVTARVVLDFPKSIARMDLHRFNGFSLLSFSTTPTNEALLFIRRIMDIVFASVIMVLALPVTLITAIVIKLTSPGPVFFRQQRCGLNGRPFLMYKFRSMVDNAEQLRDSLKVLNEMDGPVFKASHDPRVTKFGRLIRRYSIDELPQLYNVLCGDMCMVGPRPPLPAEVAQYQPWQRRRLSMKPGLTCLWQISGRNELNFQDWMRLDLSYIDNWSLLLDLKILLKTVPVVLLGKGAK